mgnify:CR=1 FL=1
MGHLLGKGNMRQQLNRIISDKKSIGMIIFMLVIPILDIVQIYYQDIIKINGEMGKPYPCLLYTSDAADE